MSKLSKLKNAEGLISTLSLAKELNRRHKDVYRTVETFLPAIKSHCMKANLVLSDYEVKEFNGQLLMTEKLAMTVLTMAGGASSVETKVKFVSSLIDELEEKVSVINALEGELIYLQEKAKTLAQNVVDDINDAIDDTAKVIEDVKEDVTDIVQEVEKDIKEHVEEAKTLGQRIKAFLIKIFG